MLRFEELKAVFGFAHEVGQRQYGHFDHDARCSVGPVMRPARFTTAEAAEKRASADNQPPARDPHVDENAHQAAPSRRFRFEAYVDPETQQSSSRLIEIR